MSYSSQILMSGAFHYDLQNSGGRGSSFAGVHPGIFRPPTSPSLSSSPMIGRSTGSLHSEAFTPMSNAKRKRLGARASTPNRDWPMTGDGYFGTDNVMDDRTGFDYRGNGDEMRYVLSGQMDTPNGLDQKGFGQLDDSVYSDVDYRRGLGSTRPQDDVFSPGAMPTMASNSLSSRGWSSYALSAIGGVVGKVWEFCTHGAFRGFYAGGGTGYDLSDATVRPSIQEFNPVYDNQPQSDYAPFHHEQETPDSTPPPPAKRRQISYGTPADELRKNWVMIEEPAKSRPSPVLPRPASRRSIPRVAAPSLVRRISKPVSRLNAPNFNRHVPPPRPTQASSVPVANREPASFASARSPTRSPAPKPQTPSRIPIASSSQPIPTSTASFSAHQPSRIPSPSPFAKQSHRRTQSTIAASPVAPGKAKKQESFNEMRDSTPRLDATARNLAAKRMKDEMDTDMRMNDFNSRLRDMIRQGKEALGTTYEVELDGDFDRGDPWESE